MKMNRRTTIAKTNVTISMIMMPLMPRVTRKNPAIIGAMMPDADAARPWMALARA